MSRSNSIHTGQLTLVLILVTILLIFGDKNNWFDKPRSFVESKILRVRVDHNETPREEFTHLEAKVVSLEQEVVLLKDENSGLRRQLQAPLAPSMSFIPAYVVSIEPSDDDVIMRVAAGSNENVVVGMPVVSEAILIGRVSHVTPRMAHIVLLASEQSKIAVRTDSGSQGLVVGSAVGTTGTALLDRVLQSESLSEGDVLVTSGEDELPPNLLVGTVVRIISEAREPYQRAEVKLTIDPADLRRVFVVEE